MLQQTIGNVKIQVKHKDTVLNPLNQTDRSSKTYRCHKYHVSCTNLDTRTRITFPWYDSIYATQHKHIEHSEVVGDVLYSIRSDFWITKESYPTYEDFAQAYGYDEDSRSCEKLYRRVVNHAEKLHKVFSEEVIESLPE